MHPSPRWSFLLRQTDQGNMCLYCEGRVLVFVLALVGGMTRAGHIGGVIFPPFPPLMGWSDGKAGSVTGINR
jgi:hypothetical protein